MPSHSNSTRPEILAPAGNADMLCAAVFAGADAVYLGLQNFNARRTAGNFTTEGLRQAVAFCHARDVRVYVTLNTTLYPGELTALAEAVAGIAAAGADAVITQDLAVAALVRRMAPGLALHGSTQMSVQSLDGARRLAALGFTRVILARELTLSEIAGITAGCGIETETFVHGALCMSVSGQCYMSAFLGGRSGNRGGCAGPCRLPFDASGTPGPAAGHHLSLKDMSVIGHLPQLSAAGVASVKIEGRLRPPEYVAAAVNACLLARAGEPYDTRLLQDVFSRSGFTDGYLTGARNGSMFGTRTEGDAAAAKAAAPRLRELYRVSRAERLPSVTGTAYGDYETNDYAGEKSSRDPGFGAKVTLSWELDLWGNLRWAKRKGGAEYLASVEDRRAMRMTLVASVAAAYFNLIALDNELSIVRRTLITRSEGLYQVQLRFEGGLTSEMVYQQAKVEYASTAALIPDLERKIKIMENGILLLMGENPDRRVVRGKMNTDAEFADSLPVGLPSGLLQRRPDVRSSEQRLRAAMAAAGMAYADRFPRLTFNLTGGLENDALSGFFRSPFSYVAGTLASPIFGFGRKQARYRAALAAYDEARLAYEQKVLTVFKEADDAVITYRSARKTAALKLNLRDAASKYVELAHLQYRAGSTNYIDVLDAQRRYFDAQIGLSNSVRDEHLALVQLYKALGGGWTE